MPAILTPYNHALGLLQHLRPEHDEATLKTLLQRVPQEAYSNKDISEEAWDLLLQYLETGKVSFVRWGDNREWYIRLEAGEIQPVKTHHKLRKTVPDGPPIKIREQGRWVGPINSDEPQVNLVVSEKAPGCMCYSNW